MGKEKRIALIVVLCMLMTLIFTACGSKEEETSAESGGGSDAGETIQIGVSVSTMTEFFADQMTGYDEAAKEFGNVEIVGKYDADMDVQKQFEHISTFSSMGVDAIAISLVDVSTAAEILNLAGDIPVIFTNRQPETSVYEGKNAAYVGGSEEEAGRFQGEYIAGILSEQGKTECNYAMFIGDLSADNSRERTDGAIAALEESGLTLNEIFSDVAGWDRTEALNKMQQVIGSGAEIDCVIANNDEMAIGALEALKAAGMTDVPVAGLDGTSNAIQLVKDGELAMTVLQNGPAQAHTVVEAVVNLLREDVPLESYYDVPFEPITPDNVDEYM